MTQVTDVNPHVGNQIVENGLCVRCAACEPACPWEIIKLDGEHYPYIVDEAKCPEGCTRCLKVCPGGELDFGALDDDMFGERPDPRSVTGVARRAVVASSTDEDVRYQGASGGFVTELLSFMLETGRIDGALVVGTSADGNAWNPDPFIARSVDDLRSAAKSKYTVLPHLRPLKEMENEIDANYAVVAVPCYVHALRNYQKVSPKLRKRLKLVIGLYCNVVFEPHIIDDVCELLGIEKNELQDLRFRHGDWPGGVVAKLKDGTEKKLLKLEEMKDEFNLLKLFYTAPRCNMCTDFSAEYADISVGDPWLRDEEGDYLFEDGRTTALVRTEEGDDVIRAAESAGRLDVEEIPLKLWMTNFEFSGRYKRDFVPKTIRLHELLGKPTPEYGRDIGLGPAKGWPVMLVKTAIRWLARFGWFRKLGLALAQTAPALAFFRWNRRRKARKYKRDYPGRVAFVEDLLQSDGGPAGGNGAPGPGASPRDAREDRGPELPVIQG